MDMSLFLSKLLFMGLGLGLTQYWIRLNFNLSANNCPPHTLWLAGHIVCIKAQKKKKKKNLLGLFPTMRAKIKLSAHDV